MTVNFDKVDAEKLAKLPEMSTEGDLSKGIIMKKTEKLLKDQGYKEKK